MASEKLFRTTVPSSSSLGEELLQRRRHRRVRGFGESLELIPPAARHERRSVFSTGPEPGDGTDSSDARQETILLPVLEAASEPQGLEVNDSRKAVRSSEKKNFPARGFRRLFRKFSVFIAALLIIIGIVCYRTLSASDPQPLLETNNSASRSTAPEGAVSHSTTQESGAERKIMLHITGAVKNPGMLEVAQGTRVGEVIQKAGGHTSDALLESINLAMVVQDGTKIHIPRMGEEPRAVFSQDSEGSNSLAGNKDEQKVNINTASETELMTLPRVGPSTAARIIEHRTKNGHFKSVEDLSQVSGIGPKTLENLLPLIAV